MDGLNKHDGNDRQKSQWTWRQTKQEREKGLKKKKQTNRTEPMDLWDNI